MKAFNQGKADATKTLTVGSSILTFCSGNCRIDYSNWVPVTTSPRPLMWSSRNPINRSMYGCWQCVEDMLQGLLLDKPMDDDNVWRRRRAS